MLSKIKNILIFVVIGGLMVAGYLYFVRGSAEPAPLVVEEGVQTMPDGSTASSAAAAPSEVTAITQDFLPVLLNVKNIRLDDAIFSDPAFATLHDSSILLTPDGTEGRPNPFAPIGLDPVVTPPAMTSTALNALPSQTPVMPSTPSASTPEPQQTTTSSGSSAGAGTDAEVLDPAPEPEPVSTDSGPFPFPSF